MISSYGLECKEFENCVLSCNVCRSSEGSLFILTSWKNDKLLNVVATVQEHFFCITAKFFHVIPLRISEHISLYSIVTLR